MNIICFFSFFCIGVFFLSFLEAEEASSLFPAGKEIVELTFNEFSFENAKDRGVLHHLQGRVIQVRGFWYPLSVNEGILAPQTQLKSCCLQASDKIEQQILVRGESLGLLPNQKVVTLKGNFNIEPLHNSKGELVQFFVLDQAEEVSQVNGFVSWSVFIAIFFFLLLNLRKKFIRLLA